MYEVHYNGSHLDTVNSAISQEVGVVFNGVWLLIAYWNDVSTSFEVRLPMLLVTAHWNFLLSQRNSYQAVLVTDGSRSYSLFLYHCDLLHSTGAAIGYFSSGNFFENHKLSLQPNSNEVACGNRSDSDWTTLLYTLHYDGKAKQMGDKKREGKELGFS